MPPIWTSERRAREKKKLEGTAQWQTARESLSLTNEGDVEEGPSKRPKRKPMPSSKMLEAVAAAPRVVPDVVTGSPTSLTARRPSTAPMGAGSASMVVPSVRSKGKRKRGHVSLSVDDMSGKHDGGGKEVRKPIAVVQKTPNEGSSAEAGSKKSSAKKAPHKKKTVAKKTPEVVKKRSASTKKMPASTKKKSVVPAKEYGGSSAGYVSVPAPVVSMGQKDSEAPAAKFGPGHKQKKPRAVGHHFLVVATVADIAAQLIEPTRELVDVEVLASLHDAAELELGKRGMRAADVLSSWACGHDAKFEEEDISAANALSSLACGEEAVAQVQHAGELPPTGRDEAGGQGADPMAGSAEEEL